MLVKNYDCLNGRKVVLLYSGGLDTIYMALKLKDFGADVIAVKALLGENADAVSKIEDTARKIGINYIQLDRIQKFVDDHIHPAILNGYYVDNLYPISASLSFPLIARVGVEVARETSATAICHGSDVFQNSMTRFNRSISSLAPDIDIVALSLIDAASREEKQAYLWSHGLDTSAFRYSVDGNLWCSCAEGGEFDDPDVFANFEIFRRENVVRPSGAERKICLDFEQGIPVAIDGESQELSAIIRGLNAVGAEYNLGQYVSWEDTVMFKARELRLAPAAEILHVATKALINCSLSLKEKEIKNWMGTIWQGLVLQGDWYSDLAPSITTFNRAMSRKLSGRITLHVSEHKCIAISSTSPFLRKNISVKENTDMEFMKSAHFVFDRISAAAQ
jgi:argininosuccinate synthase